MADPFIGFVLEERYLVNELIGAGGWGNVYKATSLADGTALAIKIVHKHHMQDDVNIKRVGSEAETLSQLQSPYVVKIIGHGLSPAPYIVMEYFEAVPLNKWLKSNGPMNQEMALELFLQLCGALSSAESVRIMHRDLKPSNVLIKVGDGGGEELEAKIVDFGMAKFIDQNTGAEKLTATGEVLGSPPYMSPEHWKGQCDNRSDIYSLGCIMYEVLSGQPAFSSQYGIEYMNKHVSETPKPISVVNPSKRISRALDNVVRKCIQQSPAERYQSSSSCIADLRQIQTGQNPQIRITNKSKITKLVLVSVAVSVPNLAKTTIPTI